MNGRFIKTGLARMADRLRQGGLAPEQWVDTLSPWMPFLLLLLILPLLLASTAQKCPFVNRFPERASKTL